jgi:hypothetical protein
MPDEARMPQMLGHSVRLAGIRQVFQEITGRSPG